MCYIDHTYLMCPDNHFVNVLHVGTMSTWQKPASCNCSAPKEGSHLAVIPTYDELVVMETREDVVTCCWDTPVCYTQMCAFRSERVKETLSLYTVPRWAQSMACARIKFTCLPGKTAIIL